MKKRDSECCGAFIILKRVGDIMEYIDHALGKKLLGGL